MVRRELAWLLACACSVAAQGETAIDEESFFRIREKKATTKTNLRTKGAKDKQQKLGLLETASNNRTSSARLLQEELRPVPFDGDPSCPCLMSFDQALGDEGVDEVGADTDLSTYGVGCDYHDIDSKICFDACTENSRLVDCDRSWCNYAWCYVDTDNCDLRHSPSTWFTEASRYYSYATCRYPDVFANDFSLLAGETIRVGLNANEGGWKGSYLIGDPELAGDLDQWSGPSIDFVRAATKLGNVTMNITEPPEFLVNRSFALFNDSSKFDLCIYATSLGFLDMCVAQYTITEQRAGLVDWVVLNTQDLYLITARSRELPFGWERFVQSVRTIFLPFENETWIFIVFFVIPTLGMLLIVHEHSVQGSAFPATEKVIRYEEDEPPEIIDRYIPIYEHMVKSVYTSFLALLQMEYRLSVVTLGGKLHLIGASFFILVLLAVYTANLAAILTKESSKVEIESLKDAIDQRFRLCGSRKHMEIVTALHSFDTNFFVADPMELGGDGAPGFSCENCNVRNRVFDFIDFDKASAGDPNYCHAAVAPLEDLDVVHAQGKHCDKTNAGGVVGHAETGMPVFEGLSHELIPLLLKLKNNGIYEKQLLDWRPDPRCKQSDLISGGETASLNVEQLSGIWVVSFALSVIGLCASVAIPRVLNHQRSTFQRVMGYTQAGEQINLLERHDSWIHEKAEVCQKTGRKLLREPMVRHPRSRLSLPNPLSLFQLGYNSSGPMDTVDDENDEVPEKWAPTDFYDRNPPNFAKLDGVEAPNGQQPQAPHAPYIPHAHVGLNELRLSGHTSHTTSTATSSTPPSNSGSEEDAADASSTALFASMLEPSVGLSLNLDIGKDKNDRRLRQKRKKRKRLTPDFSSSSNTNTLSTYILERQQELRHRKVTRTSVDTIPE